MSGYGGRRRIRKSKRQMRNAFVARPCRYRRWRWYDWVFGALTLAFFIYAVVSICFACSFINYYRGLDPSSQTVRTKTRLVDDIKGSYFHDSGLPLAISLLVAEFYLALLMILIWIWLRYLRNVGYFLILAILLILGIIFFLSIGGVAVRKTTQRHAFQNFAYKFVTKKLSENNGSGSMVYYSKLAEISKNYNCCGIRYYQDWKEWNRYIKWPMDDLSVPNECCRNHTPTANVKIERNECGNMLILKEKSNSAPVKKIFKTGCGRAILDTIYKGRELWEFVWHGFIIGILLFIFLLLFVLLMWMIFSLRGQPKWLDFRNPYEQEDLAESDIIPGTPAKSMMSESENTFYAP